MAILNKLRGLDVYLGQAVKQANLISKTLQGPINNGHNETSTELKRLQNNASQWLIQLGDALCDVLEQIHRFKVCQQKGCIGHVSIINLDEVQENCDTLESLLMQLYQLVNTLTDCLATLGQRLGDHHPNDEFKKMIDDINNLWHKLFQSSMVIEKHPPQVIRTHQCFKTDIRLLLSSLQDKVIPSQNRASKCCPKVAVYLMYEPQAPEFNFTSSTIKDDQLKPVKSKDETGCFQYDASTKRLTASFKKLVVEKVTRTSVRGNDKVAEEKLCLLFRVEGTQLQQLQTVSLPIVITVHANQEMDGEATILWDNAFRSLAYCPHFVQPCTLSACVQATSMPVPMKVPWCDLAPILRRYFKMKIDCDFSDEDMKHLREKIFRGSSPTEDMVTWRDFAKSPLPGKEHTFWGWFRGLIKVMELHDGVIAKMWRNKLIMGLITSSTSLRLLSGYPVGTFVLRPSSFQEYFCADVLAVKNPTQPHEERQEYIRTISYISKEYPKKSLADCVLEVDQMIYILTPTSTLAHPKREVLAQYIKKGKEAESLPNGYEAVVTVCTVSKTPEPVVRNGPDMPSNLSTRDSADSMDMDMETAPFGVYVASPEFTMGAPSLSPQPGPPVAHTRTTSLNSPGLGLSAYPPQLETGVFPTQSGPSVAHSRTSSLNSPGSGLSAYPSQLETGVFPTQSGPSVAHSRTSSLNSPGLGLSAYPPQLETGVFPTQSGPSVTHSRTSSLNSPGSGLSAYPSQLEAGVFPTQSGPSVAHSRTSSLNSPGLGLSAYPPQLETGVFPTQPGPSVAHSRTSSLNSPGLGLSAYPPQLETGVFPTQSGPSVAHSRTSSLNSPGSGLSAYPSQLEAGVFPTQSGPSVAHSRTSSLNSPGSGLSAYPSQLEAGVFPTQSGPSVAHSRTSSLNSPGLGLSAYPPQLEAGVFPTQPGPSVAQLGINFAHPGTTTISAHSPELGSTAFSAHSQVNIFSSPQPGSVVFSTQPATTLAPLTGDYTPISQNFEGSSTGFTNLDGIKTFSIFPSGSNSSVLGNQGSQSISTEQNNMFEEVPSTISEEILSMWDLQ